MYARLMDIIDHLGSPRVLLVGDFMLDEYVFGDADRISPEAPVPVLSVVNREYRAGGAGSVALDLLALRARVVCAGVTGNDNAGATIKTMLEEHGASVYHQAGAHLTLAVWRVSGGASGSSAAPEVVAPACAGGC